MACSTIYSLASKDSKNGNETWPGIQIFQRKTIYKQCMFHWIFRSKVGWLSGESSMYNCHGIFNDPLVMTNIAMV